MKAFIFYVFFAVTFHNISTDSRIQSIINDVESGHEQSLVNSEFAWTDDLSVEQNNHSIIQIIKEDSRTETRSFLQF